jgi:hypothetical protein
MLQWIILRAQESPRITHRLALGQAQDADPLPAYRVSATIRFPNFVGFPMLAKIGGKTLFAQLILSPCRIRILLGHRYGVRYSRRWRERQQRRPETTRLLSHAESTTGELRFIFQRLTLGVDLRFEN